MHDVTDMFCNINIKLQLFKIIGAVFQEKTMEIIGKRCKFPKGDTPTCWILTHKMNLDTYKIKEVLLAILNDPCVASDFSEAERPIPDH